jgi:photosystem II stability/assembly factor-like uncharacterized protein
MKTATPHIPAMPHSRTWHRLRSGLTGAALLATLVLAACGGESGANGADGISGTNGIGGTNGTNGTNGTDGTNGANGTNGTNGADGLGSLLATVAETAGANCQWGGTKTTSGVDTNGNHVLDVSEVTSTTYVCNGAPAAFSNIVDVTAASIQASSNTSYMADSASRVTVTLPATPVVGDIVIVSGVGTGGWNIAQNAGQRVFTGFHDADWSTPASVPTQVSGFAISGNGRVLVMGGYYTDLYTSVDAGATWTDGASSGQAPWQVIAASYDGSHIIATGYNIPVQLSTDFGATWQATTLPPANWTNFVISNDGTHMVGAIYGDHLWESTDSGQTWTSSASAGTRAWNGIAMSSDGTRQVAAEQGQGGALWLSTDAGVTWTASSAPAQYWNSVASSADGVHLFATAQAGLYTSADAGATWTAHGTNGQWGQATSSTDGRALATYNDYGQQAQVYTSTDYGVTWHPLGTPTQYWRWIAGSADGTQLVALDNSGNMVTAQSATTVGTSGFLSGSQFETVALQYTSGGVFAVTSQQGTPTVH